MALKNLGDTPSRAEVFDFLAGSAVYGNLGAFIGAGLSKAVLNDELEDIALSWGELLEQVAGDLDVDYKEINKEGMAYPDIASEICRSYAEQRPTSFNEALSALKESIAAKTAWYPSKEQRERFSDHLLNLDLNWVITTNYDLIIESLMIGASIPLGPNDSLISPRGIVPIYHLHGLRTNPDEIIIAQEDYVGLFRPTEYRQIKLALMIKESTMLIVGYGLGDVNVLTALDWSKNVYRGKAGNYPNEVVQVVRKRHPKEEPYRDSNSIILVEASSLEAFFEELTEAKNEADEKEKKRQVELENLSDELMNPKKSTVNRFVDDKEFRDSVLKVLSRFSTDLISGFVSFLGRCIDVTWERSAPDGAFHGYAENLNMILDIFTTFTLKQMPPALFETSAYALQRVSSLVGSGRGQSWEAGRVWKRRRGELSKDMLGELENFAEQHHYHGLLRLVRGAHA